MNKRQTRVRDALTTAWTEGRQEQGGDASSVTLNHTNPK